MAFYKKKRFLTFFLELIIFFFTSSLYANLYADPVSTVYRADSRDYVDVFKNGFVAWGNNINFYAHIIGISTRNHSSAFISTTSSYRVADRFARERTVVLGQPYYIYNIRPTNNFYPALDTMYHLYDLHETQVPHVIRFTLATEQEYAAYSYISPQQIRSVTVIEYVDGSFTERTITNSNYVNDTTTTNPDPYTGSDSYPLNLQPRMLVSPSGLGASFMSDREDTDSHLHPWTFCGVFCSTGLSA